MSEDLVQDYNWKDNVRDALDTIEEQMTRIDELKRTAGHDKSDAWNVYWENKMRTLEDVSKELAEEIRKLEYCKNFTEQ